MKDIIPATKQSPILGLTGMGGGVGSNIVAGGAAGKSYVEDIFSSRVWTGSGSGGRLIDNGIDLSGKGGLTWIKRRSSSGGNHLFFDTERGAGKYLMANTNGVESTSTARMSAFNSNGFTIGADNGTNKVDEDFGSWSFRKQKGFFDVVKYEGNGVDNRQISHNLGTRPGMIWIKRIDVDNEEWQVWHRNANNAYGNNMTDGTFFQFTRNGSDYSTERWGSNGMNATDTYFTVGTSVTTNINSTPKSDFIAYVFAHNTDCKNNSPTAAVKSLGDPSVYGSGTLTMGNGPFSNNANGAVQFDGNTILQIPTATYKDRLQSNCTIEGWVYLDSLAAECTLWAKWGLMQNGSSYGSSGYRMDYLCNVDTSGKVYWRIGNGATSWSFDTIESNTLLSAGQWYHIASVRQGGTMKLYINGTVQNQTTNSSHTGSSGNNWPHTIGGYISDANSVGYGIQSFLTGRISNFRYNPTQCLYTSNFTPATSNLTLTSQGATAEEVDILCCNGVNTWGDETKGNIHGDDEDKEVVKCGIWSGKGSRINLGWTPQCVIWKAMTDGPGNHGRWFIMDKIRGYFDKNRDDKLFWFDDSSAEQTASLFVPLSYGFEVNSSGDYAGNAGQNGPYVYMAIRDMDAAVMKPPTDGNEVFFMDQGESSQTAQTLPAFKPSPVHPPDWTLNRVFASSDNWKQGARTAGQYYNITNSQALPATNGNYDYDYNNGWNASTGDMTTIQSWMWKNCASSEYIPFEGNGIDNRAIQHNMGQTPEMIWIKYQKPSGTSGNNWHVWHKNLTAGNHLILNSSAGETTSNTPNFNTIGSKYFQIGSFGAVNASGAEHAAMLFSSVTGISSVGSYTGNGQTLSNGRYVNTGFQPRLIMVKRINGSGSWFLFDSLRGFGTPGSNTLSISLETSSTSNGSTYVEVDANGFRIVDDSPQVNNNGSPYLYYAHA